MDEDFYIDLIYKKMNQSLSQEEAEQLEQWVRSDPENEVILQSVEMAWTQTPPTEPEPVSGSERDAAFTDLQKRIRVDEGSGPRDVQPDRIRRITPKMWLTLAASLAGLVILGSLAVAPFITNTKKWAEYKTLEQARSWTMSDGTLVKLNRNSSLRFLEPFDKEDIRRVELKGEAFFEVTHNPEQPFVVEAFYSKIKVLGTSFNVRAMPGDRAARVNLVTGKVYLGFLRSEGGLTLLPGEEGIHDYKTEQIKKNESPSPNSMAWRTKKLRFAETPLPDVVADLAHFYGVEIEMQSPELLTCHFNMTYNDAPLQTVLEDLSIVLGAEIQTINSYHYKVKGGSCK